MKQIAKYKISRSSRRILRAFIPIACPPQCEEMGLEEDVIDHLEESLNALPLAIQRGLMLGLGAFDASAALIPKHFGKRFHRLNRKDATAYFLAWKSSQNPIQHEFIKGLKGLLCLAHFDMPMVKARIDYHPDVWVEKVKKRRLIKYAAEIKKQRDSIFEPDPLPTDIFRTPSLEAIDKKEAI